MELHAIATLRAGPGSGRRICLHFHLNLISPHLKGLSRLEIETYGDVRTAGEPDGQRYPPAPGYTGPAAHTVIEARGLFPSEQRMERFMALLRADIAEDALKFLRRIASRGTQPGSSEILFTSNGTLEILGTLSISPPVESSLQEIFGSKRANELLQGLAADIRNAADGLFAQCLISGPEPEVPEPSKAPMSQEMARHIRDLPKS